MLLAALLLFCSSLIVGSSLERSFSKFGPAQNTAVITYVPLDAPGPLRCLSFLRKLLFRFPVSTTSSIPKSSPPFSRRNSFVPLADFTVRRGRESRQERGGGRGPSCVERAPARRGGPVLGALGGGEQQVGISVRRVSSLPRFLSS